MKKTFTTMDVVEGKFVATVFDAVSNQEIFKTAPRSTQLQATLDVNNFLTSETTNPVTPGTVIKNTTSFNSKSASSTPAPRRCCGR